jgi:hypothetical protein
MWASAVAALLVACDGNTGSADAGVDAPTECMPFETPMLGDAGAPPAMATCTAPDGGTPGEGACCYRTSQRGVEDPELRLRYVELLAPVRSPLVSRMVREVLNDALAEETFNWLYRVEFEGPPADGPVTIVTGFGLRRDDGTFDFATGTGGGLDDPRYVPVRIPGRITGERVVSERYHGLLTVPVLNREGTAVQLELVLRDVQVLEGFFNSDRSCVGWSLGARRFQTAALLEAFIEVAGARSGMIVSGPIMTSVCAAIAGDLSNPAYCDQPQSAWLIQPDSRCDESGCRANTGCDEDVCDRGGDSDTGLPACNAWRLVAQFAAHGVTIHN